VFLFGGSGASLPAHPGMTPGNYYSTVMDGPIGTLPALANTLYGILFYNPVQATYTKIGVNVSVLGVGNARLGIYSNNSGIPGSLILDAGTVSVSTTGDKEITISQVLASGWYFLVLLPSVAVTVTAVVPTTPENFLGSVSSGVLATTGFTASQAFGALPNNFPTPTAINTAIPRLWLRL